MRPSKRTEKRDEKFFNALAEGCGVVESAKRACYNHRTVYNYREEDAEFAKRWEEAIQTHTEAMEQEADRRAMKGFDEAVFYKGVECGKITKFSDVLLMFRLKALRPDMYRERKEIMGRDGGPIEVSKTSPSERLLSELENISKALNQD